jgi:hypothetical protein
MIERVRAKDCIKISLGKSSFLKLFLRCHAPSLEDESS